MTEVRRARGDDLDCLAETLALSLLGSPTWEWAFPDRARRLEALRAVWRADLREALPHGWVSTVEGCASASVWYPPGTLGAGGADSAYANLAAELGPDADRVAAMFERFEQRHPNEPHYYLSLLGTHPDHAGRRLGTTILEADLARIDATGAAAFAETTNPANLAYYAPFDFHWCGEFELSDGGPTVAQMWREPPGGPGA
jgi:GNAT superfamily N-acetyltransferase